MTYYFVELFIFFRLVVEDVYCLQFIFHYTKGMLYVNIKFYENSPLKVIKQTFPS